MSDEAKQRLFIAIKKARDAGDEMRELALFKELDRVERESVTPPSATEAFAVGAGRGMHDFVQGPAQALLEVAEHYKAAPEGTAALYTKDRDAERAEYDASPVGQSSLGEAGRIAGQAALGMAVPGATGKPLAALVKEAGIGGALGATEYIPEGGSRLESAARGAAGGAATRGVLDWLGAFTQRVLNARANRLDPRAKEILGLGEQHDVNVMGADLLGPGQQKLANRLEDLPFIGTADERVAQMRQAQSAAERYGVSLETGEEVAEALQGSLRRNFESVRDRKRDLYAHVGQVAGDAPVPTSEMNRVATDLLQSETAKVEGYADDRLIARIQKYARDPNMSFGQLQLERAKLGDEIRSLEKGQGGTQEAGHAAALHKVKTALEEDMQSFATSRQDLEPHWRAADKFYREKYKPLKTSQILRKAMQTDEPDRILDTFVKAREGFGKRAQILYDSLDKKGQEAVRYAIVARALDASIDESRNVFSPAKFAQLIDRQADGIGVFFSKEQAREIEGLGKLMRAVERSGQVAADPPTGYRALPLLIVGGAGSLATLDPVSFGMSTAAIGAARALLTSDAGKRILAAASGRQEGSKALDLLARQARTVITRAASQQAAASANPDESQSPESRP